MSYILGIDIGTGSTKAVVVTDQYRADGVAQHYYPTNSRQAGYSEQDPEQIWSAFKLCIREILDQQHDLPLAISLSSAMHSLIPVDSSGKALAPLITWSDARSTELAKKLQQSAIGMDIYEATGTPIHPMSPLCKIIWIRENDPELFQKTYKFISIKEYIWFKLFGEFKIDHSIASCTGLFNIVDFKWHDKALNLAGIQSDRLSAPVSTDYARSIFDLSVLDLPHQNSLNFVIGASDGCLANLGTKAIGNGFAAVTIGTSGAIRVSSQKPVVNREAMTFSYLLDRNTYICGGPINNGGIALQWLLKNVFGKTDLKASDYTALFDGVADTPAGSNGLLFLPYLSGERAPIWDSESSGTFFGLTLQHDQKALARAVIEGICFALNDVLMAVEEAEDIKQIHVSGGFVHSKEWMQILADITGKKIVLIQEEDASAIGAAYLAFKAILNLENYPAAAGLAPEVIQFSNENHKIYQRNFQIFRQLYLNLKASMHQLYHLNH